MPPSAPPALDPRLSPYLSRAADTVEGRDRLADGCELLADALLVGGVVRDRRRARVLATRRVEMLVARALEESYRPEEGIWQ